VKTGYPNVNEGVLALFFVAHHCFISTKYVKRKTHKNNKYLTVCEGEETFVKIFCFSPRIDIGLERIQADWIYQG
jgi:hypothetical protein